MLAYATCPLVACLTLVAQPGMTLPNVNANSPKREPPNARPGEIPPDRRHSESKPHHLGLQISRRIHCEEAEQHTVGVQLGKDLGTSGPESGRTNHPEARCYTKVYGCRQECGFPLN